MNKIIAIAFFIAYCILISWLMSEYDDPEIVYHDETKKLAEKTV